MRSPAGVQIRCVNKLLWTYIYNWLSSDKASEWDCPQAICLMLVSGAKFNLVGAKSVLLSDKDIRLRATRTSHELTDDPLHTGRVCCCPTSRRDRRVSKRACDPTQLWQSSRIDRATMSRALALCSCRLLDHRCQECRIFPCPKCRSHPYLPTTFRNTKDRQYQNFHIPLRNPKVYWAQVTSVKLIESW